MADNHYQTLIQRADKLLEVKRYKRAIEEYQLALAEEPEAAYPLQKLSYCWYCLGNFYRAETYIEQAIQKGGSEQHYSFYLKAQIKLEIDQPQPALQSIQAALQLLPYSPAYLACLGRVYMRQNKVNEAIKAAEDGLRIDPANPRCLIVLCSGYMYQKQYGEFTDAARRLLEAAPNDEYAHLCVAKGYYAMEDFARAKEHYKNALRINPEIKNSKDIEGMLAVIQMELDRYSWENIVFTAAAFITIVALVRIGLDFLLPPP